MTMHITQCQTLACFFSHLVCLCWTHNEPENFWMCRFCYNVGVRTLDYSRLSRIAMERNCLRAETGWEQWTFLFLRFLKLEFGKLLTYYFLEIMLVIINSSPSLKWLFLCEEHIISKKIGEKTFFEFGI
jgi:hypothetical protein